MRVQQYKIASALLAFFIAVAPSFADSHRLTPESDALLELLVSRFDSLKVYESRKLSRIEHLKSALYRPDADDSTKISLCIEIAEEYSHYISDSSMTYLNRAMNLSSKISDSRIHSYASIQLAYMLAVTGYFKECSDILGTIDVRQLDKALLADYYYTYGHLYHELFNIDMTKLDFSKDYIRLYNEYNDMFLEIEPETTERWLRAREKKAIGQRDYVSARYYNDRRKAIVKPYSLGESLVCYDRFSISRCDGSMWTDGIENLLLSANIDLVCANQDVASFNQLTPIMMDLGKIGYAELFSSYSYSSMIKFGSRARRLIGMDSIISANSEYQKLLKEQKRRLTVFLVALTVLTLLFIVTISILVVLFRKLRRLNISLERSGRVSNSYVVGFFNQYSSYISRMNSFRRKINTSLRRGNVDYVLELTSPSKDITTEDLKYMYYNFDRAFIDIFPDYIADFNAMLKPECRIVTKPNELLNTELRIFALIKLGVTGSNEISELLHCSIKTVYNKRSGINSKLMVSKDEFERKILNL